jgi:hypothetical protein
MGGCEDKMNENWNDLDQQKGVGSFETEEPVGYALIGKHGSLRKTYLLEGRQTCVVGTGRW